jgi:hypothetical protein
MFMRRRRPLLRAAMVGGVAYHAGRRAQENRYEDQETEMRLDQLEEQHGSAAAQPAGGGMSQSSIEQLRQLAELKEQGVLTVAEFELQKQKLLQLS